MKVRLVRSSAKAAVVVALSLAATFAFAQNQAPAGKPNDENRWCIGCSVDGKTTPRTADGHPDFSGFWNNPQGINIHLSARTADGSVLFDWSGNRLDDQGRPTSSVYGLKEGIPPTTLSEPSYKPEYAAKVKEIVDKDTYGVASDLDPQYNCTPMGLPRGAVETMQIVQVPQMIAMLYESTQGMVYRIIYTDGRKHPEDPDPTFMGDSIGHWDGDTLVVDVTGLNDETWLGGGFGAPRYALMHSDQEHVIERWTRKGNALTYEATVEDPVMFTKPWVITPRQILHANADDRILESTCVPNDKGHIIKPTEADQFECNYCIKPTATAAK